MESKYFGNQEQEINNSRVDFELVEKKSGLNSKEIKEVNKYVFYPKDTPIEQINQIVKSRIQEIMKKFELKENKLANICSLISIKERIINKDIKEHKIYKIHQTIENKELTTLEKIKKIKKYSKKAGFNGINLLSNEYLLRNELIWFLSNEAENIQKISELYKKYFNNYVGFIENKPNNKKELVIEKETAKIEETDLIDSKHTLKTHLDSQKEIKKIQDKKEEIIKKTQKLWDDLIGLF